MNMGTTLSFNYRLMEDFLKVLLWIFIWFTIWFTSMQWWYFDMQNKYFQCQIEHSWKIEFQSWFVERLFQK